MLGNFSYYNPTKLYFGDESLNFLKDTCPTRLCAGICLNGLLSPRHAERSV